MPDGGLQRLCALGLNEALSLGEDRRRESGFRARVLRFKAQDSQARDEGSGYRASGAHTLVWAARIANEQSAATRAGWDGGAGGSGRIQNPDDAAEA